MKKTTELLRRVAYRVTPPPGGAPVKHDTTCCLCGTPIAKGEMGGPATFGPQFTDSVLLARPQKGTMDFCGDCISSLTKKVLLSVKAVLLTEEGMFPFFMRSDRAYFLLHPPKPPFAAMIIPGGGTASAHLCWKTPLSMDPNLWYIQTPLATLTLNRERALALHETILFVVESLNNLRLEQFNKSIEAAARVQAMKGAGKKTKKPRKPKKVSPPKPLLPFQLFQALDDSLKPTNNGLLNRWVRKAAIDAGLSAQIDFIEQSMGPAEIIAVSALNAKDIPTERPERIYIRD